MTVTEGLHRLRHAARPLKRTGVRDPNQALVDRWRGIGEVTSLRLAHQLDRGNAPTLDLTEDLFQGAKGPVFVRRSGICDRLIHRRPLTGGSIGAGDRPLGSGALSREALGCRALGRDDLGRDALRVLNLGGHRPRFKRLGDFNVTTRGCNRWIESIHAGLRRAIHGNDNDRRMGRCAAGRDLAPREFGVDGPCGGRVRGGALSGRVFRDRLVCEGRVGDGAVSDGAVRDGGLSDGGLNGSGLNGRGARCR